MWTIVPQTEGSGKNKHEVLCKHLKFFPFTDKKTGETGFGKFKFPILCVIVSDGTAEYKITWSNRQKQPLSHHSPGKYVHHWPDTMVYKTYTVGKGKRKRTFEDTLSPKVKKPGETMEWESHELFWAWLSGRIGDTLTMQVRLLFTERVTAFLIQQEEEAAAAREKKAA